MTENSTVKPSPENETITGKTVREEARDLLPIDTNAYRFLGEGEIIEETDEFIGPDRKTWVRPELWAIGMEYPSAVFTSARRLITPAPASHLTAEQIATKACAESVRDNGILGGSAYDCALRAARIALKTPAPASNLVGDEAEWIKTCTAKISNAIGGGSELFSRHGDEFRLDIDFVCKRISELRERQNEAMRRAIHLVSWKDISTAPKDGTVVDLWVVAKGAVFQASGFRWVGGEWLSESRGASLHFHYGNEIVGPSHWILPHGAPPTEFRR